MIKQIKPNSLSHKLLSLIFEEYEICDGINICDVPWRALNQLLIFLVVVAFCTALAVFLLSYLVGVVLMVLSPLFQYNLFWANLSGWAYMMSYVWLFTVLISALILRSEGEITFFPTWLKKPTTDEEEEESPPSLLSIWWKSFKEKTCVKIVVAEEK